MLIGSFFRLYHIEFGLPHSFYADEPEIAELAIKYTYEFKSIFQRGEYEKLIPVSFVYGTFPAYLNTFATMAFSKTMNLLNIDFDKTSIYIFLRSFNALLSLLMIGGVAFLTHKLFKNDHATLLSAFLLAINWKLIVHAHYINADILQTILLIGCYITMWKYYQKESDTMFTVLSGLLFGLAVGTKITTLIAVPFFVYLFLVKKDLKGILAFFFTTIGIFILSNPFSVILKELFAYRILEMFTKEGGMVFDSVDYSPFKYIVAISAIITPLGILFALIGKFTTILKKPLANKEFHIFLIGTVLIYLLFFSIQSRRVDRWMLPIIPILLIYFSYGLSQIQNMFSKKAFYYLAVIVTVVLYFQNTALLLSQFKRYTPKAEAYLWMKEFVTENVSVLVYTEEGLDPMSKLPGVTAKKISVYTDEGAAFYFPDNPDKYDYVVLSSRPMQNHKNPAVMAKYPFYYEKWNKFESEVQDQNKFQLVREFTLPKPNLIPLSDVFIYKNLRSYK